MQNTGVQAVLVVLVLFIATVKADKGGVTFWRDIVTLTCPEAGTWHGQKAVSSETTRVHEFQYDGKAQYSCEYTTGDEITKYLFYVEGKTCSNCFELDAAVVAGVIVADVVVTAFVMVAIYQCSKKKSSAEPAQSSKAPARSRGRGPPVPSPDYEQLNLNTRSEGAYSVVNRTG